MTEDTDSQNRETYDNLIINCTFNKASTFFSNAGNDVRDNHIINSILNDVDEEKMSGSNATGFDFENCNSWDLWSGVPSGTALPGANNISFDPQFADTVSFMPQNSALKAGTSTIVKYDKNGKERDAIPTIGAVEID